METIHLNPADRQEVSRVAEVIDGLLAEGKRVTVTVAEDREHLSPQQAADRLGFSPTDVVARVHKPLSPYGVRVIEPDEILAASFEEHPQTLQRILEEQTASWAGGRPLPELLDALERAGVARFVTLVRASLS